MKISKLAWQVSSPLLLGTLLLVLTPALAKDTVREEFRQTYPLEPKGTVKLDNVNGNVRVVTWDRAEIKVEAEKRGNDQERLDEVTIDIDADADQIQIKTRYPVGGFGRNNRGDSVHVDYVLTVPREVRLDKVATVNGDVEIEGVAGEVVASTVNGELTAKSLHNDANLSSVNGSLDAEFTELDRGHHVKLHTVNGKMSLTLPQAANAQVSAKTLNGSLTTEHDLAVKKNFPVGRELKGRLGQGGARVELNSVNGGIRILRADQTRREARQ
ncbi:MAG: DUF4097 family beta strand repeat-containing protein [Verrucomicrobiales bacterium]|nr:DUF4097 family beta strand repeat-containing protein [Verrucomicrobiales bacterium]